MVVEFINKDLETLYNTGYAKKYKNVPNNIVQKLLIAVEAISSAKTIADLWKQRSYHFEHLNNSERYSMRLDIRWRLEMKINWTDTDCSIGIVGITELSRHYGD